MRGFLRLTLPYWQNGIGSRAWLFTLAVLLFGILQVWLAIRLNLWSADLFDALERRSGEGFLTQLAVFAAIVLATMAVNTVHLHVKRALQLDWREWLTQRLIGEWMNDGGQYRLAVTASSLSNPDGRIAEDIRIITEAGVDLAHSLFYCILLLVSFVGILWGLSGTVAFPLGAEIYAVPGHLVWLAFLYAGAGSLMATYIGRQLISAADWRQTVEADLRYALMRGRENAETIALARSEADERSALGSLMEKVASSWRNQTFGLHRLILFSSAYSTLAGFFPILVSTPRFLAGDLSLGGLMQIAQAFQQATAALSWPVDNFPRLAELRASVDRVLALHDALGAIRKLPPQPGHRIQVAPAAEGVLAARQLALFEPDGRQISTPIDLEIRPGERVLLSGDTRTITVLCKAIAGIWPWGEGRLELPSGPIFVSTVLPYLPIGSLRLAVTYPLANGSAKASDVGQCLVDAGLERLIPRIDEIADWSQILSTDERQRLGFARLLFHRPDWILLDRAASTLDEAAEQEIMHRVVARLPSATILAADPRPRDGNTYTRRLTIDRSTEGTVSIHAMQPSSGMKGEDAALRPGRLSRLLQWLRAGYGGD